MWIPIHLFSIAPPGAPSQRQGGGSDGLHLWYGSLWKNQEGLYLLWTPLHFEGHLCSQRPRWDPPYKSSVWRCALVVYFFFFFLPIILHLQRIVFSKGDGVPTIFVAVAGRSNGLGPVMSGNTAYPVINCPPLTPDWGAQDVWSSLRLPSGEPSS